MRYSLAILFLFNSFLGFCQQQPVSKNDKTERNQFQEVGVWPYRYRVEKEAEVNQKEWQSYLVDNLELDSLATDTIPSGTYRLTAQFIIDKTGRIISVKVLNDPGYGLGNRVVQVLSVNKVCWEPAEVNGRKVKAYRQQIITFIVEEKCENKLPAALML